MCLAKSWYWEEKQVPELDRVQEEKQPLPREALQLWAKLFQVCPVRHR